jgi:hypothetical protein
MMERYPAEVAARIVDILRNRISRRSGERKTSGTIQGQPRNTPAGRVGLFYGDVGTAASKMHAYVIRAYQMRAYAYEIHARRPYKMQAY